MLIQLWGIHSSHRGGLFQDVVESGQLSARALHHISANLFDLLLLYKATTQACDKNLGIARNNRFVHKK